MRFSVISIDPTRSCMMAPKLYVRRGSPPVRSVLMTGAALGIKFDETVYDMMKAEHLNPEFLKINPQHTVPTLVEEDGYVLWDSHAINAYLVDRYGKDDSLYPKDPKKRGTVDQRLHFNNGTFLPRMGKILIPIFATSNKTIPVERKAEIYELYALLEKFLETAEYIAGDQLTIADFHIVTTLEAVISFYPLDAGKFPNLVAWYERMKEVPAYQTDLDGVEVFRSFFKQLNVIVATE